MHNPACVNAGFVHSFAIRYYQYTGDERFLSMIAHMLDYQLEHGTTPEDWVWGKVPYASADPFEKEYIGATRWEEEGMRGDGRHGIEPDKVGELGYAYLKFFELCGEERYCEASLNCADALARHIRYVETEEYHSLVEEAKNPWWRGLLSIGYGSGLRRNEILHLTWKDIDFEGQMIKVLPKKKTSHTVAWEPKNHRKRIVPMSDATSKLLASLQLEAKEGHPYIFISPQRLERLVLESQRWDGRGNPTQLAPLLRGAARWKRLGNGREGL